MPTYLEAKHLQPDFDKRCYSSSIYRNKVSMPRRRTFCFAVANLPVNSGSMLTDAIVEMFAGSRHAAPSAMT